MNSLDFIETLKNNAKTMQIHSEHKKGFLCVNDHVLLETGWYEIEWIGLFGTVMQFGTRKDKEQYNDNVSESDKNKSFKQKIPVTKKEIFAFKKKNRKLRAIDKSFRINKKTTNAEHYKNLQRLKLCKIKTHRLSKKDISEQSMKFFHRTSRSMFSGNLKIFIPIRYIDKEVSLSDYMQATSDKDFIDWIVRSTKIKEASEIPKEIMNQVKYWVLHIEKEKKSEAR